MAGTPFKMKSSPTKKFWPWGKKNKKEISKTASKKSDASVKAALLTGAGIAAAGTLAPAASLGAVAALAGAIAVDPITKATKKGLKDRAKSGNVNIGRKI